MAGHVLNAAVHLVVPAEEAVVAGQLVQLDELLFLRGEGRLLVQHLAHVVLRGVEVQKLGELAVGDERLPFHVLVLVQQVGGLVQVPDFLLEVLLPDLLHVRVDLGLVERIVQVRLHVLAQKQVLQPGGRRVEQRAVVRDVLFLDHADFQVEVARDAFGLRVAQVHVEVHGLLLAGRQDERAEDRADVGGLGVARGADRVERMAMVRDGGTARRDLDGVEHELVGGQVLVDLEQVRVAVQVVEVLEQGEVHAGFRVRVGLVHGEPGREVDGQLLVADGGLKRRLVGGRQPVHVLLLTGLDAAHEGEVAAQVVVLAVAVEVVAEHHGLHLDTVHEDDARLGVRIGFQLLVRAGRKILPVQHHVLKGFRRFLVKRVHRASCSFADGCPCHARGGARARCRPPRRRFGVVGGM